MTTVVGIDPSLRSTGICVIQDGRVVDHGALQWKNPAGTKAKMTEYARIHRLIWIRDSVQRWLEYYEPSTVAFEGYAYSRHSSSVTGLAELGGVLRVLVRETLGLTPTILTVGQCRKFVVGKSKGKADVVAFTKDQGFAFKTEDEADAYAIALTAYYIDEPSARRALDLERLEVLDGVIGKVRKQ